MSEVIKVQGAREHNLKDISIEIPRNKLIVITGLSGSGKSSLAFDTIYAEGQRRYVESLSAYARQFLGLMEKPDVDYIEGLLKRFHSLNLDAINGLPEYFTKIKNEFHTETIPLGLVHRDFKPWNTLLRDTVLIFDFEEAFIAGPPLEDLLNYYIDPIIRYQSAIQV